MSEDVPHTRAVQGAVEALDRRAGRRRASFEETVNPRRPASQPPTVSPIAAPRRLEWARHVARVLLRLLYRVEVTGIGHLHQAGARVLIVANHTSYLDAVLLALFLPVRLTFAIDPRVAQFRWVRGFLRFVDVLPLDPTQPFSTKALIKLLKTDGKVMVFPEGRITVTGSLMKVYEGPALIADRSGATILPVRITGTESTPFSLLRGQIRRRWFPRITLTVLPPRRLTLPDELRGRARRHAAGMRLTDIMSDMMFATSHYRRTIFDALLEARRTHGGSHVVAEDTDRAPLSYTHLITRAFVLADVLGRQTGPAENVGILLPGSTLTLQMFLALQIQGRVPAMLNFTAGPETILATCQAAMISTIWTSRQFVETAELEETVRQLAERLAVRYLEDVRAEVTVWHRGRGWLRSHLAGLGLGPRSRGPDAPAVVLFTAGTEGTPKGVVLSHANVLANRAQITACLDISPRDVVLNALPPFHAFGLTTGTILPLLSGAKVFFYPSALHYRTIPEVAYDIGATILFGTNTFLAGYARFAHSYDFYRVRYVFAGAEPLQAETRQTWADKFGLRILEGYGTTETSPVLATNTPGHYRPGSVGRFVPGLEAYLEPVSGIERGGRLCVRGPNVMLGYLRPDQPGVLQPPRTSRGPGWYDTGDIASIDRDGFVVIQGRAKRFAKVGAEMVSLARVEQLAEHVWPGTRHAALRIPEKRKGEQVVLLTERRNAARRDLLEQAKTEGVSELHVPRHLVTTDTIPLLGAGKTDYAAAQALVEKELNIPKDRPSEGPAG
jgi:acyl-[acyl-carrier-protein]-phospholipid O-acyltransferase/long-chain-fatty-acid--[acyl-carrier-protein] ligase